MPSLPVQAAQAAEFYREGHYAECLSLLQSLQPQVHEGEAKLLNNLCLAEFAKDNCKNPKNILKRLTEVLHSAGYKMKREKRPHKLVVAEIPPAAEGKEKSEEELTPLAKPGTALVLYNIAALLHQSRHTSATMAHLETIFERMGEIDELIVLRACLLLLEVYSTVLRGCACLQGQRKFFLERANQIFEFCSSKRSIGSGRSDSSRGKSSGNKGGSGNSKDSGSVLSRQYELRLNIAIAKVYLAVEDTRSAKKPLQLAGHSLEASARTELVGAAASNDWNDRTSDFNFTLQMLRANVDYLKKEYKKSVKLLHGFNATGPLQALFYNNMGCLHYKLSKYSSAAFYFTRALQMSVAQKQKAAAYENDKRSVPAHNQRTALGNHGEVSYNNGMALLAAHDYVSAFKCFQKAVFVFSSWPCLWFRMAECCVKEYRKPPPPLVKAALGSGRLHRFLLSSPQTDGGRGVDASTGGRADSSDGTADSDGNSGAGHDDSGSGDGSGSSSAGTNVSPSDARVKQFMTLEKAHQYLQNAMVLIERHQQTEADATSDVKGKTGGSSSPGNAGSGAMSTAALTRILQASLLNIAYVSLCLKNPVQAVLHAKRLMELPGCPQPLVAQAHLYCAEAQCQLSRIADAQKTLSEAPDNVPPREHVAVLVGLANVHILQEEYDQAEDVIREALKIRPGHIECLRQMVYINLRRGRTSRVLRLIKTHDPEE